LLFVEAVDDDALMRMMDYGNGLRIYYMKSGHRGPSLLLLPLTTDFGGWVAERDSNPHPLRLKHDQRIRTDFRSAYLLLADGSISTEHGSSCCFIKARNLIITPYTELGLS